MKYILLLILCTVSLTASAQWYKYNPFKKHERFPLIARITNNAIKRLPDATFSKKSIPAVNIVADYYTLYFSEQTVMKMAQHNMRYHVYGAASYNFSDLAHMYMKQNRLAEAKWFLLQSLNISRQQNDDRLTIANLLDLATVKTGYGDFTQARQDLTEAHQLAASRGLKADMAAVDKKLQYLQDNRLSLAKTQTSYAETIDASSKAGNK